MASRLSMAGMPLQLPLSGNATYYGGVDDKPLVLRSGRETRKISLFPLLGLILLPWLLFLATYSAMVCNWHYQAPLLVYLVIAAGAFLVFCFFCFCVVEREQQRKAAEAGGKRELSQVYILTACMFLAWLAALVVGSSHYETYTKAWFDMTRLSNYKGVDPIMARGEQLMDAGTIEFARGTKIMINMSMGFQDGTLYCVAPISSGPDPPVTYDFWAIGTDCCKASQAGFTCGPDRHHMHDNMAGRRLMDTGVASKYKMAIKQAQAAYGITAAYPIFLKMTRSDSLSDPDELRSRGQSSFIKWVTGYLVFQLVLALITFYIIAKLRRLYQPS
eukprot:TRINITY_DN80259_c0_g1_i1.p1 TRINITY_DN80259_c0_g1~~TRINITY_DN80259_c0_g1_i1.p1  ORF type:complete len:347 (-),score=59.83 TRINITY_DN80259_c0_g1_i1:25-1017(-)